jgi:hypothetical protein
VEQPTTTTSRPSSRPAGVRRRHLRDGVLVGTAVERLALPDAELVTVGVGEPPHRLAVR